MTLRRRSMRQCSSNLTCSSLRVQLITQLVDTSSRKVMKMVLKGLLHHPKEASLATIEVVSSVAMNCQGPTS